MSLADVRCGPGVFKQLQSKASRRSAALTPTGGGFRSLLGEFQDAWKQKASFSAGECQKGCAGVRDVSLSLRPWSSRMDRGSARRGTAEFLPASLFPRGSPPPSPPTPPTTSCVGQGVTAGGGTAWDVPPHIAPKSLPSLNLYEPPPAPGPVPPARGGLVAVGGWKPPRGDPNFPGRGSIPPGPGWRGRRAVGEEEAG